MSSWAAPLPVWYQATSSPKSRTGVAALSLIRSVNETEYLCNLAGLRCQLTLSGWCQYNSVINPCVLQVNPPYYVKLVELVPHPETAAVIMDTTRTLMTKVKLVKVNDRKLFLYFVLCSSLVICLVSGGAGSCLSEGRDRWFCSEQDTGCYNCRVLEASPGESLLQPNGFASYPLMKEKLVKISTEINLSHFCVVISILISTQTAPCWIISRNGEHWCG